MHFQRITLVHYHELGLKGHNRATFEKRLMRNLEVLLEDAPVHEITRISGRVLVVYDAAAGADAPAKAAQLIARVPGVARVSCGFASERNRHSAKRAISARGRSSVAGITPISPSILCRSTKSWASIYAGFSPIKR